MYRIKVLNILIRYHFIDNFTTTFYFPALNYHVSFLVDTVVTNEKQKNLSNEMLGELAPTLISSTELVSNTLYAC